MEDCRQFFANVAEKCPNSEASISEQVSETAARGAFMRAFGRKMQSMSDAEYEAKARRAAYFAQIPSKTLRAMTSVQ